MAGTSRPGMLDFMPGFHPQMDPTTGLYRQPTTPNNATGNLDPRNEAGMRWNPETGRYERTPAAQGADQGAYTDAAIPPSLRGILDTIPGMGGSGGPGGTGGPGGYGGSGVPTGAGPGGKAGGSGVAGPQLPDAKSATDAAFATAKDRSGQISRAALDSLRGELGATGNLGSGAEVQGVRDIISAGAGIEGQATRDAASKQADVAADFAKTKYAGEVTQRGQDVQAQEAQARLAFEQREAAAQRQMQLLTLALSGINGSRPSSSSSGNLY